LNFVAKENMNWPQLFVNQRQRDENSLINKLRITSYPTMILVSPERKIIGRNYREIDELKELLIEKTN
jgi:protein-disulfide isomerase-like protein with CxxC motif